MRQRPQSLHGPRGCSAGPQKLRKLSPRSLPERGSQRARAKAEGKAPGYATLAASELKGKRDRRCCSCNGHEKPHWCLLSPIVHRHRASRGSPFLKISEMLVWSCGIILAGAPRGAKPRCSSENPASGRRREARGQRGREFKVEAVARAVFRKGRADGRARGGPTERECAGEDSSSEGRTPCSGACRARSRPPRWRRY